MHLIQERLDRALTNAEWLDVFPKTKVIHLPHTFSDHFPLLIFLEEKGVDKVFSFRCKEAWTFHEEFGDVVSSME